MRSHRIRTCLVAGIAMLLAALLASCGSAPVAEGQVGTVNDPRPNQAVGIDNDLLKQVDAELAKQKAAGANVEAAQTMRDAAVRVAQAGRAEEANGSLRSAAGLLGILAGGKPQNTLPAVPAIPAREPVPASEAAGATVLNADLGSEAALQKWQRVGPDIPGGVPEWAITDGMLAQRGVGGAEAVDEQTGLVTGDASWRDLTIRTSVLVRTAKEVGLIVRQNGESYYRFRVLALGTGTNSGNLILEKVVDGAATQIGSFDGPELSADTWHTLGLSARGSTITATVDGKPVGSVNDTSLAAGRAGVSTLAMSGAFFANIQVIGR